MRAQETQAQANENIEVVAEVIQGEADAPMFESLVRRYRRQGAVLIQHNASYHKDREVGMIQVQPAPELVRTYIREQDEADGAGGQFELPLARPKRPYAGLSSTLGLDYWHDAS